MRRRTIAILLLLSLSAGSLARWSIEPGAKDFWLSAHKAASAGRLDHADIELRKLLARQPNHTDARLLLAEIARAGEQSSTVVAALQTIPDSFANAVRIRIAEGDAWLKLHRSREAEACWLRARSIDPQATTPIHRLLYLYAIQLRRDEWQELLWLLYDRDQAELREMIQLMIAATVVWETDEQIELLTRFVAADPLGRENRIALLACHLRRGDIDKAYRIAVDIADMWPADDYSFDRWWPLLETNLAAGNSDDAERLLSHFSDAARADRHCLGIVGSFRFRQGRFAEAAEALRNAVPQRPYDAKLRHQLAQALRASGKSAAAESHAKIAARLAKIERLCNSLYTGAWNDETVREIVRLCESLALIEEAIGWTRLGRRRDPDDHFFREAESRLAGRQLTSSRNPPTEVLP